MSRPAGVARRVDEHRARRSGRPGWCSRRQRTISAISASRLGGGRRGAAKLGAPRTTWWSPTVESPVARARARRQAPRHPRRCAGRRRGPCASDGGHVGAVAAGVHPHRPADRTGHADRPLEAGEPGGGGAPGQHRQLHGRAGAARSVPSMSIVAHQPGRAPRRGRRSRRRPRAGSSPARRTSDGHAASRRRLGRHGRRSSAVDSATTNRAAAPPTRYVVSGPSGTSRSRRGRRASRRRRVDRRGSCHGPSRASAAGQHLVGQRRDVAAAHRDADVAGRAARRRRYVDEVGPARAATRRAPRMGVEHGVDDELAGDTRGSAASPDG